MFRSSACTFWGSNKKCFRFCAKSEKAQSNERGAKTIFLKTATCDMPRLPVPLPAQSPRPPRGRVHFRTADTARSRSPPQLGHPMRARASSRRLARAPGRATMSGGVSGAPVHFNDLPSERDSRPCRLAPPAISTARCSLLIFIGLSCVLSSQARRSRPPLRGRGTDSDYRAWVTSSSL